MTIVPKQPDLIDRLIELENRNAATEKGCGDGGSTTPDPETDSSTPQTITRDVIVNLEGATRRSGAKVFPDGTFPRIGPSHIIGTGVDLDTYKAQQVRFDGKHRWWRRSASAKGTGVAPGQRIFALPPGWWPPADQVRDVPCGKGKTCTIEVEAATGIVRYISGPNYPQAIDLAQFGAFPGGGGACPGNDPDDPTGAFDGRQWDCCETAGEDSASDPIVPPGGVAHGWTDLIYDGDGRSTGNPGLPAQVMKLGEVVFMRGALVWAGNDDGEKPSAGGGLLRPVMASLPEGFEPADQFSALVPIATQWPSKFGGVSLGAAHFWIARGDRTIVMEDWAMFGAPTKDFNGPVSVGGLSWLTKSP